MQTKHNILMFKNMELLATQHEEFKKLENTQNFFRVHISIYVIIWELYQTIDCIMPVFIYFINFKILACRF